MDNTLDKTTLATISLLESRLLRIEHLLYGTSSSPISSQHDSAPKKMKELERRFNRLLSQTQTRVYSDLLKIQKSNPDLFHAPAPCDPPSQLGPDAIRTIVMSSASSLSATLSALTAVKDIPVPDPSASATLITLERRMQAVEAVQLAQASEIASLRSRSEALVRSWYENSAVVNSQLLADAEGRVQRVEREVRRRERQAEEDNEL